MCGKPRRSEFRVSAFCPEPSEVLKGLKSGVLAAAHLGKVLLLKWELHFLLNSLHLLVVRSSGCVRSFLE